MSNRLSYASLQSHVGALLTTGRTHFGKTSHGRDWKDGVFSVATEAWFEVLAQQDDFLARSANIRARFTRDKERVSFLGSDVTFALLAETLASRAFPFADLPEVKADGSHSVAWHRSLQPGNQWRKREGRPVASWRGIWRGSR